MTSGPSGVWPANSPDLNWIENIWGIMAARLEDYESAPDSVEEFKRRVISEWDSISVATLKKCAASMPDRLRMVIKQKGEALRDY